MVDKKGVIIKIIVLWFVILVLGSFYSSVGSRSDTVSIRVVPEVPREGEPIIVTFSVNNPTGNEIGMDYSFYANGESVMKGNVDLEPGIGRQFQYIYSNPLELGEQITFYANTRTDNGVSEKSMSIPAYTPQIWSSFVSFASFSTSLLGSTSAVSSMSLSSMGDYDSAFGTNRALNAGLIFSIVLIILLIFLELSEPLLAEKSMPVIGNLRVRFRRLTGVLFVIFVGMVFTQVALIVGGVG